MGQEQAVIENISVPDNAVLPVNFRADGKPILRGAVLTVNKNTSAAICVSGTTYDVYGEGRYELIYSNMPKLACAGLIAADSTVPFFADVVFYDSIDYKPQYKLVSKDTDESADKSTAGSRPAPRYCTECGFAVCHGDKYCAKCGAKLQ